VEVSDFDGPFEANKVIRDAIKGYADMPKQPR
jgi:hypothetical protein